MIVASCILLFFSFHDGSENVCVCERKWKESSLFLVFIPMMFDTR